MALWTPGIQVTQLNKAVERITGWTQQDHEERGIMELAYPDPKYRQEVSEHMNSLGPGFKDIKMMTKKGDFIETSWANISISDGRNIGIGIDVSERKKYEKLLSDLYERLQTVVNNIIDGVIVYSPDGQLLDINQGAELILKRLGIDCNDPNLYGFELYDLDNNVISPDQWPKNRCLKGESITKKEYRTVNNRIGKELYIEYNAIPIFEDGQLKMVVFTMHDLTDRKKAHLDLLAAYKDVNNKNCELEKMKQLHENLLYIIAHDLKGPIDNINLSSKMMQKAPDVEKKMKIFDSLGAMVKQLDSILKGLTEVIRIQNPDDLKFVEINLDEVIRDIKKLHESSLMECKGFILHDISQAPVMKHVQSFVHSILRNLISNAIKYRDDNRQLKIEINSKNEGEHVLVTIKDNGIGIDMEKYGKTLFQPFKRFTNKADGTGVGLYIIKNLIEKNGGHIRLESRPGIGTTFYCYFKEYGEVGGNNH